MRHMTHLLQDLLLDESGQDLIEYALIVALIALGATAGMQTVAADINNAATMTLLTKKSNPTCIAVDCTLR